MKAKETRHGRAIQSMMVRRGIDQAEIARRMGVSHQVIQSRMRSMCRVDKIEEMLDAMMASWSEFGHEMEAIRASQREGAK